MKTLMSGVWKWLLERSTRRQPLRFAAVSLLTPLISASGCGWRFALSLPPPSKYIFPSHYPANAAASYQTSAFLPPLQRICGHELRFWARIKMAQHFTRHYALPASVCVCVLCVRACATLNVSVWVGDGFTLLRIARFRFVSVQAVNAPCLSAWLARFKLILSGCLRWLILIHTHNRTVCRFVSVCY